MDAPAATLASDAIKEIMLDEISDHSTHGWGDYRMSERLKDLIRRARLIGVPIEPPYEGYSYLHQVESE